MNTLNVVCAAIIKDGAVFATQRGYGNYAGGWEFPGGKIEAGELAEDALAREINEELEAAISVGEFLEHVSHTYPDFHLEMDCYLCTLKDEHINLLEHSNAKWLGADELNSVDWLEADKPIVEKLREVLAQH